MKIQLDSAQKIIRVEENVNLGELVKYLDKLLPKNSPIGYWKDFKMETNTVIYNWSNPIYVHPYDFINPYRPTWEITCGDMNGNCDTIVGTSATKSCIYNLELN